MMSIIRQKRPVIGELERCDYCNKVFISPYRLKKCSDHKGLKGLHTINEDNRTE